MYYYIVTQKFNKVYKSTFLLLYIFYNTLFKEEQLKILFMTKPKHWYAEEELQHKNYSTWPLLVHQETKVHAWAVPTYQMVSETYCTRHLHCAYLNTILIILWRCLSYAYASGFNILFHLDSMSSSIFSHGLEFAYHVALQPLLK